MLLLGGGEMAAKVFCFFAFTHLGRVLGPQRYGSLEFVLALIVFFTLPADCGLGSYGARELARGRKSAARLLAGIGTLRMLLALGSFAVLLATVATLPPSQGRLLAIYGLGFLLAPLQLQWHFQGRGEMQWVAAASVVRYGVFAALVFACLRPDTSLAWIGVFEGLSLAAAAALCVAVARREFRAALAEWPPRTADLLGHLRSSWPIGLSQVSWAALWYFATVFLGLFVADQSLGQFTASHRIVMAVHTFVWMYFYNLLPAISKAAAEPGDDMRRLLAPSLTWTAWAGGLVAILMTILADEVTSLAFGEAYRGAGRMLAVLIWAVPLALVSGHYRYALVACDQERLEFRGNAIGAVMAVLLASLLIPRHGAVAAAGALAASALVVLVLAHASCREAGVPVPSIARVVPPLCVLAVSGLAALGLSGYGPWMAAAGAACVYLSLLAIVEARGLLRRRVSAVRP